MLKPITTSRLPPGVGLDGCRTAKSFDNLLTICTRGEEIPCGSSAMASARLDLQPPPHRPAEYPPMLLGDGAEPLTAEGEPPPLPRLADAPSKRAFWNCGPPLERDRHPARH